jgi:hypothetical protein
MIGIFDVLMAIEATKMAGDEPVLVINADPVGIGFDRDALVRELCRHGVAVGVEGDAELAGRAQRDHPRQIVGIGAFCAGV